MVALTAVRKWREGPANMAVTESLTLGSSIRYEDAPSGKLLRATLPSVFIVSRRSKGSKSARLPLEWRLERGWREDAAPTVIERANRNQRCLWVDWLETGNST